MLPPYPPGVHPPPSSDGTPRTFSAPKDGGRSLASNSASLRPFVPSSSTPWDYAHAAHLLRRAMVGPRHNEILEAVERGLDATLDLLFTPFTPSQELIADFANQDPIVAPFGPEASPEGRRYRAYILGTRAQLSCWWMQTMVNSPVSLQERMTFFWHNHFVSDVQVVIFAEHMLVQNQLFRTFAWGKFNWLVWEVTVNPAMLVYLDGVTNIRTVDESFINENYSRELLEIFTMGVYDRDGQANYSQRDVSEGARALTGWQIPRPLTNGVPDETRSCRWSTLDRDRHDFGAKEYMGLTGNFDAFDIIDIIFSRRSAQIAQFLCTKLYREFVSEQIDAEVVDAMATLLQQNEWNLEVPLRALLKSEHFYSAQKQGGLVKATHDLWVGLIRTLGVQNVPDFERYPAPTPSHSQLYERLGGMGHRLLFPPNVKGWPGGHAWLTASTAPPRMKFASDLVTGRMETNDGDPLYTFDPVEFARTFNQPSIKLLVRDIAALLLASPISAREEEYLLDTVLQGGGLAEWSLDDPAQKPAERLRLLLDAIVQLPRFQLY